MAERVTGVRVKRFLGDQKLAQSYLGVASTLAGTLRDSLGGVKTGKKTWNLNDGTVVQVRYFWGLPRITIDVRNTEALDEFVTGLICIPRSEVATSGWGLPENSDNPIGTPNGTGSKQFWLRSKRKDDTFAPEFSVRRHTPWIGGNIEWVSKDYNRRYTFFGPNTRYFLYPNSGAVAPTGFDNWTIYEKGSAFLNLRTAQSFIQPSGTSRATLTGFAVQERTFGSEKQTVMLAAFMFEFGSSRSFRHLVVYKFSTDTEWKACAPYLLPSSDAFASNYRPSTMSLFNASGTKCAFVITAPFGQLPIMLEATFTPNWAAKTLTPEYQTFAPLVNTGDSSSAASSSASTSGTDTGSGGGTCDDNQKVYGGGGSISGTGSWNSNGSSNGVSRRYLCADYDGDELLIARVISRSSSTSSGTASGSASYAVSKSDFCSFSGSDSDPPQSHAVYRTTVTSRSYGSTGSTMQRIQAETTLEINGVVCARLQKTDVTRNSSVSVSNLASPVIVSTTFILNEFITLGAAPLTEAISTPLIHLDLRNRSCAFVRTKRMNTIIGTVVGTATIPSYTKEYAETVFVFDNAQSVVHSKLVVDQVDLVGVGGVPFIAASAGHGSDNANSIGMAIQAPSPFLAGPGPVSFGTVGIRFGIPGDHYTASDSNSTSDTNPPEAPYPISQGTFDTLLVVTPRQRAAHAPVQRKFRKKELFVSLPLYSASGLSPVSTYYNFLYLDDKPRDPDTIFKLVGENTNFIDISSF